MGNTSHNSLDNRPRLIIFEGGDGVGKTTQARSVAACLGAKIVRQPTPVGPLGFIRDQVKHNPRYGALERQLMHSASHIVDAYTELNGKDIIMDRSPLSGQVYGKLSGLSSEDLSLVLEINLAVYQSVLKDKGYRVDIVHMCGSRYDQPDQDVYESTINSDSIRHGYLELFQHGHPWWFTPDEQVHSIVVFADTSKEQVLGKIKEALDVI